MAILSKAYIPRGKAATRPSQHAFGAIRLDPSAIHRAAHSLIGKILFLVFMFSLVVYPRLAPQATESSGASPRIFDSILTPDFRVGTTLPNTVPADGTTHATSIIFASPINGFTGTVTLSDPSLPAYLTCTAIAPSTIPNGSGHAMVSCSSSVAGTYNVTIVGTSDAIRHIATSTLGSQPPPRPNSRYPLSLP